MDLNDIITCIIELLLTPVPVGPDWLVVRLLLRHGVLPHFARLLLPGRPLVPADGQCGRVDKDRI